MPENAVKEVPSILQSLSSEMGIASGDISVSQSEEDEAVLYVKVRCPVAYRSVLSGRNFSSAFISKYGMQEVYAISTTTSTTTVTTTTITKTTTGTSTFVIVSTSVNSATGDTRSHS